MLERAPTYDAVSDEKVITSRKPVESVVTRILELPSVCAVVKRAANMHRNGEARQ